MKTAGFRPNPGRPSSWGLTYFKFRFLQRPRNSFHHFCHSDLLDPGVWRSAPCSRRRKRLLKRLQSALLVVRLLLQTTSLNHFPKKHGFWLPFSFFSHFSSITAIPKSMNIETASSWDKSSWIICDSPLKACKRSADRLGGSGFTPSGGLLVDRFPLPVVDEVMHWLKTVKE